MVYTCRKVCFNCEMDKQKAIEMLGGTVRSTADAIGISYQAVKDWPDVLSARIADRVDAAVARKRNEPAERCPQIEQATGGLVRCEDLRPDVQWSVLRGTELATPQSVAQEV